MNPNIMVYRSKKYPAIHKPATIEAIEKFAKSFTIHSSGCWTWNNYISPAGYGYFHFKSGQARAHRWFYQAFHNVTLAAKDTCDHLCNNRTCVNPKHIEIVDSRTNNNRSNSPSALNSRKTHCKNGHEFTKENTYIKPNKTERNCRTCAHEYYLSRRQHVV